MLMKFSDLSQSDRSNWVMWQVKDPCPRPGWDGCLTREKFKNLDNIALYLIVSAKSKWKNKQIKQMNSWIWLLFVCIYVLDGNLQWNCWICEMNDYLKLPLLSLNSILKKL